MQPELEIETASASRSVGVRVLMTADRGRFSATIARVSLPHTGAPADEVLSRLERMRAEDVDWRRGRAFSLAYFAGDEVAAGFMTTGGTESLLMAVLAARERGRKERGIAAPEMVLPTSAHAAFEKGAPLFRREVGARAGA